MAGPRAVRSAAVCFEHDMNGDETRTSDPEFDDVQAIAKMNGALPCDFDTGRYLR